MAAVLAVNLRNLAKVNQKESSDLLFPLPLNYRLSVIYAATDTGKPTEPHTYNFNFSNASKLSS